MKELNDLTDLEIEKYIAEIEGVKFRVRNEVLEAHPFTVATGFSCAHMGKEYSPLRSWNITGPLMVKYDVVRYAYDAKPQRAICLAIIAQYRLKGDTK